MHSSGRVCQRQDSSASSLGAQISLCLRLVELRARRSDQETVQTGPVQKPWFVIAFIFLADRDRS